MARCSPANQNMGERKNNGPNEAFSIAAMCVSNPGRSSLRIKG
jgi:hypothetical protein